MFFVNTPPVRDYRDPWTEDFWSRFSTFRNGHHRVAYIYEKADNSTFRYRAYNMVQTLAACSEGISAGYFFLSDGSRLETVVKFADTIVFCRMRYESTLSRLVALARSRGKLVLYDVDDLVFDTDLTHLILGALAQDFQHPNVWDHWFAYISRIGVALRSCDAAITTNSQLATRISDFTGRPAFIVPNYMNRQQLDFSNILYEEKRDRLFQRTEMIHVGYFSGTPTHKRDFDLVVPALCALMERRANVRLLIVGYLTLPPALERFRDRIEVYPLHDFINLQRVISLVEINIVPLINNVFTRCKSELKYFEAAAVGAITIATPTPTYAAAIEHGRNGWLAPSLEWEAMLEQAVEQVEESTTMRQFAREHAITNYCGAAVLGHITKAVTWGR